MCTRMRALSQIRAASVQCPRLARRLSELLNAGGQTADDVTASEGGLHGCCRQAAFKIIKHSPCRDAGNDLQPVELRITYDKDGVIGISKCAVQPFRVPAGVLLRDADEE